jgi:hypothetical protein
MTFRPTGKEQSSRVDSLDSVALALHYDWKWAWDIMLGRFSGMPMCCLAEGHDHRSLG